MLMRLVHFIVVLCGVVPYGRSDESHGPYQAVRWKATLCCALPAAGEEAGSVSGSQTLTTSGHLDPAQCHLHNSTDSPEPSNKTQASSDDCLDIQCWLDRKQTNLICNLKRRRALAGSTDRPVTISLQLSLRTMDTDTDVTSGISRCEGDDAVACSIALLGFDGTVSVTVDVSGSGGSALSPVMLVNTRWLRRPDPPVNLHYNVTSEGDVILRWSDTQPGGDLLLYEVHYSSNSSSNHWEGVQGVSDLWVTLNDLSPEVKYTVQVRCQNTMHPDHWSEWSQPFYITLQVSYIPAVVFASPGEEVTVYCVFHYRSWSARRAVWFLNLNAKDPESRHVVVNDHVSAVTLRAGEPGFDTLMCCQPGGEKYVCKIPYAKIYIKGMFNASIACQTSESQRADTMTCRWSMSRTKFAEVRFRYRWYDGLCEKMSKEDEAMSEVGEDALPGVGECLGGPGNFKECTLRDLRLISCYKLWLEVIGGKGEVRSFPVYIMPIDVVKPRPPSDLKAWTLPSGTLQLVWRRPDLPAYELQYELRYVAAPERAHTQWKVVGPLWRQQAEVAVPDPCVGHWVEVRCKRFSGTGYWSDWSEPHNSVVHNSKAPERGPDFWRVLQEDPARNQTNVTLIFKAQTLPIEEAPCCVEGLVVQHQASGGAAWSNDAPLGASHTFQWREEVHTVSVMAQNSMGASFKNRNMTLAWHSKRQCVRSFSAAVNGSCVALSWTLLSDQPAPQSFVVEWTDQNGEVEQGGPTAGSVDWIRVSSTHRTLNLCRRFYGSEVFTLYAVFVDGEGEPVRCMATRGDPAAYLLLLIIAFLSLVLFVTLIISQNQMTKLVWKDVPNPNNCSWAQGLDFRKVETMENVFRHPEGLTACSLLLVSECISEAEIVEKPGDLRALEKEWEGLPGLAMETVERASTPPLPGNPAEPVATETPALLGSAETSGQSSVTYSTVLLLGKPGHESLSTSSDEGNFSANTSDISGSFPGGLWELENPACSGETDPRRSCSYNSVEELSETSEQEDEAREGTGGASDLYYLGMEEKEKEEEEEEEEEEDMEGGFLKEVLVCVEANPLLGGGDLASSGSSGRSQRGVPLYLPQFQTAPPTPPMGRAEEGTLPL